MRLIDKIKFVLNAPKSSRLAKKYSVPPVMSDSETLDYILKNECSICRYGDGELNLMRGVGIKFQKYDVNLANRLIEIASAKKNNVLICVPNFFISLDAFTDECKKWFKNVLRCTRGYWYKYFRNDLYGDANLSRFYLENINKDREEYVRKLKMIWEGKRLLIVEGKKSRLGMGNDLFDNSADIKRILCPPANAFDSYQEILDEVNKQVTTKKFDMLICAIGPTATVLCYDVSDKIQALDLGHIDVEYEWFLCKAQYKQAIKNKSVTEVVDYCSDDVDKEYIEQVLSEIN